MKVSGQRITLTLAALLIGLPSMAQAEPELSEAFLEYLATLVEDEGEWVDPLTLEDEEFEVTEVTRVVDETVIDETHSAEESQ